MNMGAFGENFPYTNFHDLNLDWIVKIAKDFLEQYTHIQETVDSGIDSLTEKAEELENLLQEWYDTHSDDIPNQLADALEAMNAELVSLTGNLDSQANLKLSQVLASIPDDYTEINAKVDSVVNKITNSGVSIRKIIAMDSSNTLPNVAFVPQPSAQEVRVTTIDPSAHYTAFSIPVYGLGIKAIKVPSSAETIVFFSNILRAGFYKRIGDAITVDNSDTFYPVPEGTIQIGVNCVNLASPSNIEIMCAYEEPEYKINKKITKSYNPVLVANNVRINPITAYNETSTTTTAVIFQNNDVAGYFVDNTGDTIESILCAESYDTTLGKYIIAESYEPKSRDKFYIPNNFFAIVVNVKKQASQTITAYPLDGIPNEQNESGTTVNVIETVVNTMKNLYTYTNNVLVQLPDGSATYNAFWIRDYAMCLNNPLTLQDELELDMYNLIKSKVPTSGDKAYWIPDHIMLDEDNTPIWKAGSYNPDSGWGYRASLDGAGYLVDIAYHYFMHTHNISFVQANVDFLKNCIDSIMTGNTVYVNAGQESVVFGFYDTVKLNGYIAFNTLQAYTAYKKLAEMCKYANISFSDKSEAIANEFNSNKFLNTVYKTVQNSDNENIQIELLYVKPSTGLSATVFDVWTTAYAVNSGILTEGNARRCALSLREYAEQYILNGMAKHVPTPFYYLQDQMWEEYLSTVTEGRYQEGGYWLTPMYEITKAISSVDKEYSEQLKEDILENAITYNFPEWINSTETILPNYGTSICAYYNTSNL